MGATNGGATLRSLDNHGYARSRDYQGCVRWRHRLSLPLPPRVCVCVCACVRVCARARASACVPIYKMCDES